MRRTLITAALSLVALLTANAQTKIYCDISRSSLGKDVCLSVDFGQESVGVTDDRLVDENGELLLFESIIDGLNYMSSLGWNLEEVYVIPSGGNGSSVDGRTHWVMSKIVGEDGDPTPLRTRQQVRDEQKRLKKMKKEAKRE